MVRPINTDRFSKRMRARAVRLDERAILLARLSGSQQEQDLSKPVNCGGFGRVHHFRRSQFDDWSPNPLPMLPAARALKREPEEEVRAQVFQIAACNWRCWYCFVDVDRLSANPRVAEFFTAEELVDRYLAEAGRPCIIDLSGGQPNLVPEWTPWVMRALESRQVAHSVFLWSDDNLSNYFYWEYLDESERRMIAEYPMYARVGCFKGFDEESFAFNTGAEPSLFARQLDVFSRLASEGVDLYAYATFTHVTSGGLPEKMHSFCDRLQRIHPNLPLRVVPLKILPFAPVQSRMGAEHERALAVQVDAHDAWIAEIDRRFTTKQREALIIDVGIR